MGQTFHNRAKDIDARNFKYPDLIQMLQNKEEIPFDQIINQCILLGSGYAGDVYLYKRLNIVVKIMKYPNQDRILNQIIILDKVNSMYPNLFKYLVCKDNRLIGFCMKFFQGKKIWEIFDDQQNIYRQNPLSRVRLVKKIKEEVKKLQALNICHGDMHIDNIMIIQPNKQSEDCQIIIIDYGLAFMMNDFKPSRPSLTGYKFMIPSQSKRQYFYYPQGINVYMLGRVSMQILLMQKYQDYECGAISQNIYIQLERISQANFHPSVRKQIQQYLHQDIEVRVRSLNCVSKMEQVLYSNQSNIVFNNNWGQVK